MKLTQDKAIEDGEQITDEECIKRTKQKGLALELLKSCKYRSAINEVRTQYLYKNDVYPADLAEAFEIIEHHSRRQGGKSSRKTKGTSSSQSNEAKEVVQVVQYMVEKEERLRSRRNKTTK